MHCLWPYGKEAGVPPDHHFGANHRRKRNLEHETPVRTTVIPEKKET